MMYQAPAVHPPSVEEIHQIAKDLNMGISKQEVPDFHALIVQNLRMYDVSEKYQEPCQPVKYPRTPGYRPQKDDNKFNAWYYKTNIPGAAAGTLSGYKVAVKDSFPVAGVPMMHGSRVVEGYVPDYDPTVVTRVLDAGATIVGKAVCEDFCFSGNSFTSHPFPVLNPHDVTRSSGGSSSGCGVLVQCGEADIALGGDQAGSVREPASWLGVVALKATYGLIPYTGLGSMVPAVDHCGPMTRTVYDCALALEVLAGDDGGLDARQRRIPDQKDIPKYSQLITNDISGKKVGLVKEGFLPCTPDVAALVEKSAKQLAEKGALVEEVSIPIHSDGVPIWMMANVSATHHTVNLHQGLTYGPPGFHSTSAVDSYFAYAKARSRDFSNTTKVIQLESKYVNDKYGMRFYSKGQNLSRLMRQEYDKALEKYDVLIMPTMTYKAPKLPSKDISLQEFNLQAQSMIGNTCPFNSTGHPAITINAGFSEGLPIGMQIVGRHLADDVILNVAYAYEQLLDVSKHSG